MPLYLKAAAKCDSEECEFEEDMYVMLDLADGASVLVIGDLPPPPSWEVYIRLNKKKLRCPECIAQRKRDRLRVVNDEAPSS
jgi:hypothetical protein